MCPVAKHCAKRATSSLSFSRPRSHLISMTQLNLIRSGGTAPGATESLAAALAWLVEAGIDVHPKVIVERYPDGGRSFAHFIAADCSPEAPPKSRELRNVATFSYGMESVMTQPGLDGSGRIYGLPVEMWHDIGVDLVPLMTERAQYKKALEEAHAKAMHESLEDLDASIAVYGAWKQGKLVMETCNLSRYPGFKELREASGMRPIRLGEWAAGNRVLEHPDAFTGLNAIADQIALAEPAWHQAFDEITSSEKSGAEAFADVVAATQRLNAVIAVHIPEIARLTGNSESTLRQVYCGGDEIAAHFGGSAGIAGFGPAHVLRMVAKYQSFNTAYWDSQGYEFPWKARDEFSRSVVDAIGRGEPIPPCGNVATLTRHDYARMRDADEVFQSELERVYGVQGAADGRYRFSHDDQSLQRSAQDFVRASEMWSKAVRRARDSMPVEKAPEEAPKAPRRVRP